MRRRLLFALILYLGYLSACCSAEAKVIEWSEEKYGSPNHLNFTMGYELPSDLDAVQLRKDMEEAIRHWAVGVYEMTNGKHVIKNVKIIQGNEFKERFHMDWLFDTGAQVWVI